MTVPVGGTPPPLDFQVLEAELRRVTGSPAADAVTRSTAGIQLLIYARMCRAALQDGLGHMHPPLHVTDDGPPTALDSAT